MAAINVIPAGNQLYQVEIDQDGDTSTHELTIPDDLFTHVDSQVVSMQDVALAAVDQLVSLEGRDALDHHIDLGAAAARHDEFVERVTTQAEQVATTMTPPDGWQVTEADAPSGDDRLLAEVQAEQEAGEVSSSERGR